MHTDDPTTLALAEVDPEGVARYRFYERGDVGAGPDAGGGARGAAADDVGSSTSARSGLALEPIATALEAVVERLAGTRS